MRNRAVAIAVVALGLTDTASSYGQQIDPPPASFEAKAGDGVVLQSGPAGGEADSDF
jgi:hypothetical protein